MTIVSLKEIVSFDEEGKSDGLQFFSAKNEYEERKEEQEYAALFKRLQKNNSAKRKRKANPEASREYSRQYWVNNKARISTMEREKRQKAYEANPVINQCLVCGKVWSPPYTQTNRKARFCSPNCCAKYHHPFRKPRNKTARDMEAQTKVISFLQENPGATVLQVALLTGRSVSAARSTLYKLRKSGKVSVGPVTQIGHFLLG